MHTNYRFSLEIIKNKWLQTPSHSLKKYDKLYRIIKECIINAELLNHWLLPSTRLLSETLNISRTTVIKAYELLLLEKLIVSKRGSGYQISFENITIKNKQQKTHDGAKTYQGLSVKAQSFVNNYSLINRDTQTFITFRPGLPPLDIFPVNKWKNLKNKYWQHIKSSSLSYSEASGLKSLKESIKNYLYVSRGIRCDNEQIIILSGSLQSLYLISNALINSGDTVVLENPTFPNVHSVFKSIQANIIPIPINHKGIDLEHLENLNITAPKVIHTTPSNHYPLGARMSLKRRKKLLNYASKNKSIIIENDYENEIGNHYKKLPTIFSLDTENRTVYMGTFNRLLHPSIRLGFMVVPHYLINAVNAIQEHSHRFVAPSMQLVMSQFIDCNYLYKHIQTVIEISKQRHQQFTEAFKDITTMKLHNTEFCSLHLVATFTKPYSKTIEEDTIMKLKNLEITAFPLSKCYLTKQHKKGLIFGYASARSNILNKKLINLKNIIE